MLSGMSKEIGRTYYVTIRRVHYMAEETGFRDALCINADLVLNITPSRVLCDAAWLLQLLDSSVTPSFGKLLVKVCDVDTW
ncbi:hypothetical protein E2C01_021387 [Portunus trituberculatus]|uniref:Uncharacterized protein n=1 Tax=Portunus trituberculatus TaxID=210409 RepID=A0A5B7E2H2_PORTR|nr:hypothetical protein [Portunus trituberculatus]